jgi:hypothetical protein
MIHASTKNRRRLLLCLVVFIAVFALTACLSAKARTTVFMLLVVIGGKFGLGSILQIPRSVQPAVLLGSFVTAMLGMYMPL